MDLDKQFKIVLDDGSSIMAEVIVNFKYLDTIYTIYGVNNGDMVSLFCAKNIDGNLIKITDEDEIDFVNTVVNKIVSAVGGNNG